MSSPSDPRPKKGLFRELLYVFPYTKSYGYAVVAGLLTLAVTDLGNLLVPWLMKLGIDGIQTGQVDSWFPAKIALTIVSVALFRGIVRFGWRYYLMGAAHGVERDLRIDFYGHVIRLPMPFFARNRIGELLALSSNDLTAIRRAAGDGVLVFADFFFSFAGVLYFMLAISPELTLFALIPAPIVTLLFIYFGPKIHTRFGAVQDSFGALTTDAEETIAGLRVIRSYNQEAQEAERFAAANQDFLEKNVRLIRLDATFHSLMFLVPSMLFPIVLVVGGIRMVEGQISVGDFIAFTMYIGQLVWPMMAIGFTFNIFQRAGASIVRVRNVMEEKTETDPDTELHIDLKKAVICAKNLSFTYPGAVEPALKNVNLTLHPAQTSALMGRTGSGKTTLLNLLLRLQDPPRGTLFFDETDILDIPKHQLRALFAVAPQDPFLFTDTLNNNINFANPVPQASAHVTTDSPRPKVDAETLAVTIGANLHDEIKVMPDQFETVVGERGTTLSGGQRQRAAIARAFRAKRDILILDDPLSAVDAVTESKILGFIRNAKEHHTLIMVTNRIRAAELADNIVIFDHGMVVDSGTAAHLLQNNVFFRDIYRCQITDADTIQAG